MSKQNEKAMNDLQRLVASKDFKSEDDLMKFISGFIGNQVPASPVEALTNQKKAVDLVFEAYEQDPQIGFEHVLDALELDPDCIEAYEFLGSFNSAPTIASAFYEKGIQIGRKKFGGQYLKKNKGHFWGLHETRAFMRCMQFNAECLYQIGKVLDCIDVLEEMIELNPDDNQGVRDQLLLYLIEVGNKDKFLKYQNKYKNDFMAFAAFNFALFAFINEGESKNAETLMKKAISSNKHVVPKLLTKQDVTFNSDGFTIGSKEEAEHYLCHSKIIWKTLPGAIDWLKKVANKSK